MPEDDTDTLVAMKTPANDRDWARLLKANWERLADSEFRDFYVASHAGWRDPQHWSRQARRDTIALLYGLDDGDLSRRHVLEIGCGVGRLVPFLAPRVKSYTGVDIAAGMIEEARRRCDAVGLAGTARFFVSDGLGVPPEAADRAYGLVLSLAVLIHCPRDVIRSLLASALAVLEPGGQLRFQLRADRDDPTGIVPPPDVPGLSDEPAPAVHDVVTEDQMRPIQDGYYMGHAFRYDEAERLLAELGGAHSLFRFDPQHLYAWVEKS
jgi:SAM-dependent methyltransferase